MRQQLVILLLMGFGILSCAKTEIETSSLLIKKITVPMP
jgi:hypothetical protein